MQEALYKINILIFCRVQLRESALPTYCSTGMWNKQKEKNIMINKVTLIGNMGDKPEVKVFDGGKLANFTLATSESWKDKSGEKQTKTEWHKIVVYSEGLVGVIEKYCDKGSKVYLEGSLKTRKYTDKEGVEKYTTEIVLNGFNSKFILLDSKKDDSKQTTPVDSHADIDDDIPF
jgi:single-strand DNA-binding protein